MYTEKRYKKGERPEPLVKRIPKPAEVGDKRTYSKVVTKHEPFRLSQSNKKAKISNQDQSKEEYVPLKV